MDAQERPGVELSHDAASAGVFSKGVIDNRKPGGDYPLGD
jgi:hypothetical protein